ncbi:MAG: hypothetical protein M0R46_04550 [Candidatus Muirbacterium halophilum]|nr:hypothetical protein [Candidatus Muirbacterium halophilum]MCK9475165.1 hypothetical protein [Candidatus Muirbacterium halophilum]
MTNITKYILIFLSVFLILGGCSNSLVSPEALVMVTGINNDSAFTYNESSQEKNITLTIKTSNGIGVNFVAYKTEFYYSDNIPVGDTNINKTGIVSKYIAGYTEGSISLLLISSDLENFVEKNIDTKEDNIHEMLAKITLIGIDENENQISCTGNISISF